MPDVMVIKEVEEDAVPIVLPRLGRRFLDRNRESCLLTWPWGDSAFSRLAPRPHLLHLRPGTPYKCFPALPLLLATPLDLLPQILLPWV